jgi:hypothetical protein
MFFFAINTFSNKGIQYHCIDIDAIVQFLYVLTDRLFYYVTTKRNQEETHRDTSKNKQRYR